MKTWNLIFRLVISRILRFPGRAVITIVGIMAASCAVIWIVSGFDALVAQFDDNSQKYLGRYDVMLVPSGPPNRDIAVAPQQISELKSDPAVLEVNPVNQSRVSVAKVLPAGQTAEASSLNLLLGNRPPVNGAPPLEPTLVGTFATQSPYELAVGNWLPNDDAARVAVIGVNTADELNIHLGDRITVTSLANQLELEIVGLVEQPTDAPSLGGGPGGSGRGGGGGRTGGRGRGGSESSQSQPANKASIDSNTRGRRTLSATTSLNQLGLPQGRNHGVATRAVYVTPGIAAEINGYPFRAHVLQVALREGFTATQFAEAHKDQWAGARPALKAVDFAAVKEGMASSRNISGQRSQAWIATGMASLAAIFIIFSTLSMGVSERSREMGMLRAIALTRTQIAGVVLVESIVLSLVGWLAGLLAGWLMLLIGSQLLPALFSKGATVGIASLLCSGVSVLTGALGAAVLPAWRATRISPVDTISHSTWQPSERLWTGLGLVGLLAVAVAPFLVFVMPLADTQRTLLYSVVAYPLLFVGMLLATPLVVIQCERWLGPRLSKWMGLNRNFTRNQLTTNIWRTMGATLALAIGLGLYTSTQTWGYSMLQPFLPGKWLPDVLVGFHPVGLSDEEAMEILQVPGILQDQVMPLAVEQAKLVAKDDRVSSLQGMRYDNAVIFGIDAERAFTTDDPFLDLHFLEGTPEEAALALANGKACVISQDHQIKSNLKLGDTLSFEVPVNPGGTARTVDYEIVGIVELPGWHWLTKFSGVRRHFVRTEAMVFAGRDSVREAFGLPSTEFFWLNRSPDSSREGIESALQLIAEKGAGQTFRADGLGEVTAYRPFARVTFRENIDQSIRLRADSMIQGMSYLPLVTLAIMSLAIANAILASVKSRTWEFGVLRSIGMTRGQLAKLILLEAVMIGVSACAVSLIFGLTAGWCAVGMAQYAGGFFAGPPPLLIPWSSLGFGIALTLTLCVIAALWPALRTGLAEPLRLLQAGRSSY